MNFSNIESLTIPEGVVAQIHINGVLVWSRKLATPTGLALYDNILSWNPVEHATRYQIIIDEGTVDELALGPVDTPTYSVDSEGTIIIDNAYYTVDDGVITIY